jgi:hypothetical protein
MMEQEIFETLKTQLQGELGALWSDNQDAFKEWATRLAKIYLLQAGQDMTVAKAHAEAGLALLKARLRFRAEAAVFKIAMTTLETVLSIALTVAKKQLI